MERELSDVELVNLTLVNKEKFALLIERYEAKLKRYVLRLGKFSSTETEDLVQEIFIKTYRNLNSFDLELKFSSWLYRIAHNHVISLFRYNASRPTIDLPDEDLHKLADEFNLNSEVDQLLFKEKIARTLAHLKPAYQEVLTLKFLEEYTYDEISDILKKPTGTVATLIYKAKNDFKKIWE